MELSVTSPTTHAAYEAKATRAPLLPCQRVFLNGNAVVICIPELTASLVYTRMFEVI